MAAVVLKTSLWTYFPNKRVSSKKRSGTRVFIASAKRRLACTSQDEAPQYLDVKATATVEPNWFELS